MSNIAHWHGFHLYYHGSLDLLLTRLVHPLVSALAEERLIEQFFFLRYGLGGPHVRLRLRMPDDVVDVVKARVEANAEAYFVQNPSPKKLTDDEIRRDDEFILAGDPNEQATGVMPSPSVCVRPFKPETWRYGGADLLPYSIDYFCISSARALRFLESHEGVPQAKRLSEHLRHIVAEAVAFASNADELLTILAPPLEAYGDMMNKIIERADRTVEAQKAGLCRMVRGEIEARWSDTPPLDPYDPRVTTGPLCVAIRAEPIATRLRILKSQLHISANRVGLMLPEECYLRRMAWAATKALLTEEPSLRMRLDGLVKP